MPHELSRLNKPKKQQHDIWGVLTVLKNIAQKILDLLSLPLAYMLRNQKIREALWSACAFRPETPLCHWCNRPNDIEEEVYRLATIQSAQYVLEHFSHISGTIDRYYMLQYCVQRSVVDGLYLEFGVYNGDSINCIADTVTKTVHGFDSFDGLPENWEACKAGEFSRNGIAPEVRDNVTLHIGWFDITLPKFIKNNSEPASFIHIDSDLYSSAKTVLTLLRDKIVPGTVIVFDEYFNYPNWQQHEFKAFQEFVQEYAVEYEYIAYCSKGYSVGILIKSI